MGSSDFEFMADPPTEVDSPEREPAFSQDPTPPVRTDAEVHALVLEGLPLVDPVARQLSRQLGSLVELDELMSLGRAALVETARGYDPARAAWPPYARKKIRWAMLDGVRRATHHRSVRARASALHAAERVVEAAQLGTPDPNLPETSHAKRLASLLAAQAAAMAVGLSAPYAKEEAPPPSSVSVPAAPEATPAPVPYAPARGEGITARPRGIGAVRGSDLPIPIPDQPDPEHDLQRQRSGRALRTALELLPPRQRALVERHYFGEERFDHIAASLGISKSWASRLHGQAMEALARLMRDHR